MLLFQDELLPIFRLHGLFDMPADETHISAAVFWL
jgi:hypothetical protein